MAPAFDPDELGERMASLEMEHEEAVEHVREALRDEGFGLPVEFSVSDLLREKVNSDLGPYYVLGGCNPGIADRALATTKRIGGLFPCNFAVWEEEPIHPYTICLYQHPLQLRRMGGGARRPGRLPRKHNEAGRGRRYGRRRGLERDSGRDG